VLAHWDDVKRVRREVGPLASWITDLGSAAGTKRVGVTRWQVDPGKRSTPVHAEGDEEEIFFVLGGSGLSYQWDWEEAKTYEIGAGDCIVHRVEEEAHTLVAGPDGLDVLAFGERTNATASELPRAGVLRMGATVDISTGPHPWEREAAAGELELPDPSPRPKSIVNVTEIEGDYEGRWKRPAREAGAERTGLSWARLQAGEEGADPHVHSAEEEIFVVLEGTGTLDLWPSQLPARRGVEREQHELRAGHVVSRPAGSGVSHHIRAGTEGITYLAYGERNSNDIVYYPRSGKVFFRGLGLMTRLDPADPEEDD
jgi:uncharacterized cupin superfamily protein